MTTQNMSMAVSKTFWRMVKDSVEQQADAFKAARYNLETEWKNNFPRQRQCDREELFEKARGEILDEVVALSQLPPEEWHKAIKLKLWEKVSAYVFENIYIPAAVNETPSRFNTVVDIKLKHWTDKELPAKSIQIKGKGNGDELFAELKAAVLSSAMQHHVWDSKAPDYLRVIQMSALEERQIPDKKSWEAGARTKKRVCRDWLKATREKLDEMKGPGSWERWLKWRPSPTEEQQKKAATENELRRLLTIQPDHPPSLGNEEAVVVRRNLEAQGIVLGDEAVKAHWHLVYREHFLRHALQTAQECRGFYYHYRQGLSDAEVECGAVPLFWRLSRIMDQTSTALRHQITNTEQRRLEKEIKEVLDEWSQEREVKKRYLKGRRVELAEELKTVRTIQERLEDFVEAMKTQKS